MWSFRTYGIIGYCTLPRKSARFNLIHLGNTVFFGQI